LAPTSPVTSASQPLGPDGYKLLEAACQSVAASQPKLQRRLGESADESAISITTEISGFLGAARHDRVNIHDTAEQALQPLMLLFDTALLQVCDLSYFGLRNMGRARIIWPDMALPKRPSPNAVFYVLSANLAQSMQAFRLLILHGFESQARTAFRSVAEIAELMIVVLADDAAYREYIKPFTDEKAAYQHWRTKLSPSVIRKSLSAVEAARPLPIPIDMTADEIRNDTYSWLSRFAHVDYAAHVVAAHPQDIDGNFAPLAMLGSAGEMSKATLAHALVYLWITLLRLEDLMWANHGWGLFRGARSRRRFQYRCRAFDALYRGYLPTYWEDNPPSA
jgi:hypothetical protein